MEKSKESLGIKTTREERRMMQEKDKREEEEEDRKEQAQRSTHWSDKAREDMNERDWRIFREDFSITTKVGPGAASIPSTSSEAH